MREIFLSPWTEVRGTIIGIEEIGDVVRIHISFDAAKVEIKIPISLLQTNIDDIGQLIGGKVSILRTESRYFLISSKRHRRVKKEGDIQ